MGINLIYGFPLGVCKDGGLRYFAGWPHLPLWAYHLLRARLLSLLGSVWIL